MEQGTLTCRTLALALMLALPMWGCLVLAVVWALAER